MGYAVKLQFQWLFHIIKSFPAAILITQHY